MKEKFEQIRKTFEYHKKISETKQFNDFYRVDRTDALQYFSLHKKWREKIIRFFNEIHDKKEKIVYVDICGRASGKNLGADKSYLFSLQASEIQKAFSNKSDVFINGDLFNSKDFSCLIKTIQKENIAPALVTFKPMAGLQDYFTLGIKVNGTPNYEEITYRQLGKRLEKIIEILIPGGYIHLERPFQFGRNMIDFFQEKPQNQFELSIKMKKIARKCKCKIEINSEIGGPYFLINKPSLNNNYQTAQK